MKPTAKLDGHTAENQSPVTSAANDFDGKGEGAGGKSARLEGLTAKNGITVVDKHIDVHEEEGCIIIPCKELPDGWSEESYMLPLRSLDRPFVFPGEQIHILACLSAYKQDREIIEPFNVAEVMSKNGIGQNTKTQNDETELGSMHVPEVESSCNGQNIDENAKDLTEGKIDNKNSVAGESVIRVEEYRRQTEVLLQRFRNSHFFARIAEADEALWSKRKTQETFREPTAMFGGKFIPVESSKDANKKPPLNASIDRASLHASTSGGIAKTDFQCSLLANGDIVVLLQVNIGVDFLRDPVLEILQFEKHQERTLTSWCSENLVHSKQDPYGDLLKWLLPVHNSISPPPRFLSPPQPSPSSSSRSSLTKPSSPNSFGSQNFLLGHFKSQSMSSISSNSVPAPTFSTFSSRPNVGQEDWDQFSSSMSGRSERSGEGLLSFRGVPLEPERFSVRCGLEGIYKPGRRWRRKIEIIQPLEIHSFAVNCNTEDLLCVQIKNVSPAHAPDIVMYLDTITLIFEEASKRGHPLPSPIACIEAGNDRSLPGLALRKGEEHSIILKPATSLWSCNVQRERSSRSSQLEAGSARSSVYGPFNTDHIASANKYAVLVSCRCNYTESRLLFKHPTSWQPRIPGDFFISVASPMPRRIPGSDDRAPPLPVQVLTLQASNLTNEDLPLTLVAPASLASPSVVSLKYSPASPMSPLDESAGIVSVDRQGIALQRLRSASMVLHQRHNDDGGHTPGSFNEQTIAISDELPRSDLGCTHLWLKSTVPLGCVPSQCTATVKLELLPLTDGIITLDSLHINVEKGISYVPEHPLKIAATSSISSGTI